MTIFSLECFLSLERTHYFYESAEEMHISQSAISRYITLLENELGTPLFVRSTQGAFLTEAGKKLLPYAQSIISECDRISDIISEHKNTLKSKQELTIYTFPYMATYGLLDLVENFEQTAHYSVKLIEKESVESLEFAKAGGCAAITFARPDVTDPDVDQYVLKKDGISAIFNEKSPLAAMDTLKMSDLKGSRVQFISKEQSPFLSSYLSSCCLENGVNVNDEFSSLWTTTISCMLLRYDVVSLMPTSLAQTVRGEHLKRVPIADITPLSVVASVKKGEQYEPAIRFFESIQEYI